ncbi:hypothetical protein ACIA5D_46160 [Actinoplanes sp. NPDC051513]|uniref:hypothetical protein n=1 Tax=Actinoplanes sp. NPDC051513 TaxID=3363908 RepID=UPI00378E9074
MTVDWGEVGDRPLAEAATVASSGTVHDAVGRAGTGWVVITDGTGSPLAAAAPGAFAGQPADRPLAESIHELPPTVIVPSGTRMRDLLRSWVIDEIEPDSGFVVVAGGEVVGVWAGADMRHTVAVSGERGAFTDAELPGEIKIPLLTHVCGYVEGGARCSSIQLFPEPPAQPVRCANPAGLSPHAFAW